MAKKIKFPLEMKNGVLVRTLEELRENFDPESLVEYYESGKLAVWLGDRYYDVERQKVLALDSGAKNFVPLLCECLGIKVREEEVSEIDAEFLKRRVEKLNHLKKLTENEMLLKKVDDIAITQEDLISILDNGKQEVYLCEGDFTVPVSVPNMTYIGIFNPTAVVRATDNVNFKEQHIVFKDMAFIWDVSGVTIKDRSCQAEQLYMEGKYEEAAVICRELLKEDNPRAIMLLHWIADRYICDDKEAKECLEKGAKLNSVYSLFDNNMQFCCLYDYDEKGGIVGYRVADNGAREAVDRDSLDKNKWQFVERYKERLKKTAEEGTPFDKCCYGYALLLLSICNGENYYNEMRSFYQNAARQGDPSGCSYLAVEYEYRDDDCQKAIEWYQKAAERGYRYALERVGICYQDIQDYAEAMRWYQKAAETGDSDSQKRIGDLYYYGYGVILDEEKAREWYQKAADNGNYEAKSILEERFRDMPTRRTTP